MDADLWQSHLVAVMTDAFHLAWHCGVVALEFGIDMAIPRARIGPIGPLVPKIRCKPVHAASVPDNLSRFLNACEAIGAEVMTGADGSVVASAESVPIGRLVDGYLVIRLSQERAAELVASSRGVLEGDGWLRLVVPSSQSEWRDLICVAAELVVRPHG